MVRFVVKLALYSFYVVIAKNLPRSHARFAFGAKQLRYFACRRLFRRCGKNVNVERGVRFPLRNEIVIGDGSGIGVNAQISKCVIGANVMMGPDVVIFDRNHNYENPEMPLQQQGYRSYPVVEIGDNTFVGQRVIILPGRKIGKNVVIGAGSVVTRHVPDYAVVGGNPARLLKMRKN